MRDSKDKDSICVRPVIFAAEISNLHRDAKKNLRAVRALLAKSKREIEIQSVDFDYLGLCQLATELQRTDRVITLVVGDNLTQSSVETLVSISGDHFNLRFV